MNYIYYRYLIKKSFINIMTVSVIGSIMVWMIQVSSLISSSVGFSAINKINFFGLCVLMLPGNLSICFPISVFIGTIITITQLQSSSEIVAMRSLGIGDVLISRPIVLVGIVYSAIGYIIALYINPICYKRLRSEHRIIQEKVVLSALKKNHFNHFMNASIYFEDIDENGDIKDLTIWYHSQDEDSSHFITSKKASFEKKENGSTFIVLKDAADYKIDLSDHAMIIKGKETYISLSSILKSKQVFSNKIDEIVSIFDLYKESKTNKRAKIEIHTRLSWSFYSIVLSTIVTCIMLLVKSPRHGLIKYQVTIFAIGMPLIVYGILGIKPFAIKKYWILIYLIPIITVVASLFFIIKSDSVKKS